MYLLFSGACRFDAPPLDSWLESRCRLLTPIENDKPHFFHALKSVIIFYIESLSTYFCKEILFKKKITLSEALTILFKT